MDFHIVAAGVIGFLAAAFLLVTCYVVVDKCWRRNDIRDGVSSSGGLSNDHDDDHFMFYSPELRTSEDEEEEEENISQQCSACLNEFHVNETVRVIPHCFHLFHVDCVDPKNASSCPLCQTRFSCDSSVPADEITAPNNSPVNALHTVVIRGEDEYEVIEIGIWNGNTSSDGEVSLF